MSTDLAPAVDATPAPRTRRRRIVVGAVVGIVVLGLVAVVVGYVWTYQPMTSGLIGGIDAGDTRTKSASNSYGTEYWVVDPQPGSSVRLSFSLQVPDGAPFDVTIEDVGSPLPMAGDRLRGGVESMEVAYRLNAQGAPVSLSEAPVRVPAGSFVLFTVDLVFADCAPQEGGHGTDTIPVTYRALGVTHEERLPLGYKLTVAGGPFCPPFAVSEG